MSCPECRFELGPSDLVCPKCKFKVLRVCTICGFIFPRTEDNFVTKVYKGVKYWGVCRNCYNDVVKEKLLKIEQERGRNSYKWRQLNKKKMKEYNKTYYIRHRDVLLKKANSRYEKVKILKSVGLSTVKELDKEENKEEIKD